MILYTTLCCVKWFTNVTTNLRFACSSIVICAEPPLPPHCRQIIIQNILWACVCVRGRRYRPVHGSACLLARRDMYLSICTLHVYVSQHRPKPQFHLFRRVRTINYTLQPFYSIVSSYTRTLQISCRVCWYIRPFGRLNNGQQHSNLFCIYSEIYTYSTNLQNVSLCFGVTYFQIPPFGWPICNCTVFLLLAKPTKKML